MRKLARKIRLNIIAFLLQSRSKSGYYAIDMNSDGMGLGARIVNMLEILLYCDTMGYRPLFKMNYKEKNNTTDYFRELFYYKNELPVDHSKIKYTSIRDTSDLLRKKIDKKMRLNMAKNLFDKYLAINQNIIDEVDNYANKYFVGKRVLGIHYRSTDKSTEAPEVTFEELLSHIRKILAEDSSLNLIFISSDNAKAIQYLESANLSIPIVFRDDVIRSETDEQFHLKQENSKVVVNHDAIVNCLILSRCHHLLKTASLLSDCSVIFNPEIRVSVINAPYQHKTWWPTSEINEYALLPK